MPKTKFLIETSAVRPALNESTHAHRQSFELAVVGGDLWTSVYIRMEFVRVWICEYAHMAFTVAQCDNVSDALVILEQQFSIRKVKAGMAGLAAYLRQNGTISNSRAASEEIAALAVQYLRRFDRLFPRRITNACGCQIGGMSPEIDYNSLLKTLHEFYVSFKSPVTNCEVNNYIQLGRPKGRTANLLSNPKLAKLSVVKNLADLATNNAWVTCTECGRIGDAIIALEQPKANNLLHVDASFNELCDHLSKPHTLLPSVTAAQKAFGTPDDAASPSPPEHS